MKKILAIIAIGFLSVSAQAQSPNEVVQAAVNELAAALDGRKEELENDPQSLRQLIDDILLPRFDRRYAAQLVLGRNWRNASEAQREGFIDVFYAALRNTYAEGVLEFNEDRIEILPFRGDLEKPRTNVRTSVTLDDGTKVPVNYGLVKRDSGWMMFDVTIEGISYVRNYRAEINSEIQATSLDAVIARLEKEVSGD